MIGTIYNLEDWRAQGLEALGADAGISFQPRPGGEVFTVPHPLTLTDDQHGALDRASGSLSVATVLLGGGDTYARFVAAGGRASDVMMAWRVMQQSVELDPTLTAFSPWSGGVRNSSNLTSNITIPASAAPSINGGAPSEQAPAS
ncbi:hypothetical protein [Nocardia sp. NPDC046763]|uniref:hypothetical protein n=1 Tax=Nocardia sp. NPDC046763 TaxID=3155256 RepID=UPI0034113707